MTAFIVLIGAGGHAVSVTNVVASCGYSVVAYVDDDKVGDDLMGIPVVGSQQCIRDYSDHHMCIAIGDNAVRERVYKEYKSKLPNAKFPTLIHKSSVVGVASLVGEGTVVMPLSNIGANSKIGNCCIVNTSASIDHDSIMKNFSSVGPGVVCGGNVTVGTRTALSIGALVKHGLNVGDDVVIGANSYVNKSIESGVVAYGSPCKIVRDREKGDAYLG